MICKLCSVSLLIIGDFVDRLKASEGADTVVNSVGDVLEQQVRKAKTEMEFNL